VELIDYLCVAMLCVFRFQLLEAKGDVITKLMHYPPLDDTQVKELLKISVMLYKGDQDIQTAFGNFQSQWEKKGCPRDLLYPNPMNDFEYFMNRYWRRNTDLGLAEALHKGKRLFFGYYRYRPEDQKHYFEQIFIASTFSRSLQMHEK